MSNNKPQVLNLHRAVLIQNNELQFTPKSASGSIQDVAHRATILNSSDLFSAPQRPHEPGASPENVAGSFAEASNWIMSQSEILDRHVCASEPDLLLDSAHINAIDGDDLSNEDDLDSTTNGNPGLSRTSCGPLANIFDELFDDHTTKRLKTFATTTLHNERSYLLKICKVLDFKLYLESHFNGSQTDLIVLFTGMSDIYKTHDIVASKLEDYLRSINDLLNGGSNRSTSQQAMRETFLANALQLLANIMEISFPVYYEFLRNYSKAMTILDKLEKQAATIVNCKIMQGGVRQMKSFLECKADFFGRISDRAMVNQPSPVESNSSKIYLICNLINFKLVGQEK
jgi:hypothetical protein